MREFFEEIELFAPSGVAEAAFVAAALAVAATAGRVASWPYAALLVGCGLAGFVLVGHPAIPGAVACVALAAHAAHRWRAPRRPGIGEVAAQSAVVACGFTAYELARTVTEGSFASARANALHLIDAERALGLYFEERLQGAVLESELATRAFTATYTFLFLPAVVAAVLWLFLADRGGYRVLRNSLGISAALAILTIVLVPVAPPRLIPESGLVDTIALLGGEQDFANEYAALPSLHVGWVTTIGFVVGRSVARRWGPAFAALTGGVMLATVIATGNHYWADGALGILYTLGPAVAMTACGPCAARRAVSGPVSSAPR